jgi:hypothetical protein
VRLNKLSAQLRPSRDRTYKLFFRLRSEAVRWVRGRPESLTRKAESSRFEHCSRDRRLQYLKESVRRKRRAGAKPTPRRVVVPPKAVIPHRDR